MVPWIISNVVLASLLALTAWFVQRRLQCHAVARVLWVLVLVKLVTPPLVSVPLGEPSGRMACALGTCGCAVHAARQTIVNETIPWVLLAAWSAGVVAVGWTAWRRWARFQRLLAHASPAPPEWQSLSARLSEELSIGVVPQILAVPGRLPPLVVPGRGRPRMLLPRDLMDQLSNSQREALLLHELVHIKRGDHLVRMLELFVGVAYWWLPVFGSIGRHLRACEESCCDAAVVAHLPQARRDYARLLLDVVDFASPLPRHAAPQATAMSAASNLEQRMRAILGAGQGTRRILPAAVLALGMTCATLPCQLHYNLAGRSASPSFRADCESAQPDLCFPNGDGMREAIRIYACPSFNSDWRSFP